MELIDREELFRRLKLREKAYGEKSYDGFHMAVTADVAANVPTIEAVPLEPLCEWLEENAGLPTDDYMISKTAWKRKLKQWMEEQHEKEKG